MHKAVSLVVLGVLSLACVESQESFYEEEVESGEIDDTRVARCEDTPNHGNQPRVHPLEIALAARSAGVACGERLALAVAVSYAESKHCPAALSDTNDYGIWQINRVHRGTGWRCDIYDPMCNAEYMADISSNGTNWRPWYTYRDGLHLRYMERARYFADQACD